MSAPTYRTMAWVLLGGITLLLGCAALPVKKYYVLNYVPTTAQKRLHSGPYPFTMRLKEFDIEEAYNRPQIVYRRSPFELQYYYYRVWAVKPTRMITDLVNKHLTDAYLLSSISRRLDEGAQPDYELSGIIEAIEEYDNEDTWFAHLSVRFRFVRVKDGAVLYNRRFDLRRQVFQNQPEYVIKEMSMIMEYMMNQAVHDLDVTLAREYGVSGSPPADSPPSSAAPADADSAMDTPDLWKQQGGTP